MVNPITARFAYIASTDTVGLFGDPHHQLEVLEKIWGDAAHRIGLEIIASPRALSTLKSHPDLQSRIAGFHAHTQPKTPLSIPHVAVANAFMSSPEKLVLATAGFTHAPYILMHNTGYHQYVTSARFAPLRQSAKVLVVENDGNPGDLLQATHFAHKLGGKNLVIDWLHYAKELRVHPAGDFWHHLLDKLDQYGPLTAAWHISVGTRDNLPDIPPLVLQTAAKLKQHYDIRVVIEHQFAGLSMLHNRPHLHLSQLAHLRRAYTLLNTSGLLGL